MNKLFLIDGHALIFKMYFAFLRRPMINSKGKDTSILFGFTKYVLELIEREKPSHIAIAFDPPGGTFRNELYPEYKANRDETPRPVIQALEPLLNLCKALGIKTLMIRGYEADDVIGTIAKRFGSESTSVYMVTPDKDYGQLIDSHIFQLKPAKAKSPDELLDTEALCRKYGISRPEQVIDLLTICGDTADNVPGVKGVGEVGAGKLIAKYGSVSSIYEHIAELSERQQAMFNDAKGHIALSQELVTIRTDVPAEVSLADMEYTASCSAELDLLFEEYEFASLRKYTGSSSTVKITSNCPEYQQVEWNDFKAAPSIAILPDEEEILLCNGTQVCRTQAAKCKDLLENEQVAKIGVGLKQQYKELAGQGISLAGKLFDIELLHYLLNPELSHKLEQLSMNYLGVDLDALQDGDQAQSSLFDAPESTSDKNREVLVTFLLKEALWKELSDGLKQLFDNIEEPLLRVLANMEIAGVKVDTEQLSHFADSLKSELSSLEAEVREMAAEPGLNVSSPKQVGDVLFDKLKLDPKARKSARGAYSTDEATLQAISDRHPIVGKILEFRAVKKLLSTYIEPFPSYISPLTGRVHTSFNQALTATGRLSSSNPNLQNIPIRSEQGKEIRRAFVPAAPTGLIVSADYSQIELRIMAHLCCDEHLTESFAKGIDVHAATASRIFDVAPDVVTPEQRRVAKMANFGIMYGISSFGLGQRLGVGRKEAKQLIDDYFEAFPSIRGFIDDTIAAARENGYVETVFGRRRYLPEINSGNQTVKALAERTAVNTPIQGTAADIIKLAMIAVDRRIREEGLKSRMVLQIHDELLFDALPEEIEVLIPMIVEEMENVAELNVPLTVECNYGKNWLEAH